MRHWEELIDFIETNCSPKESYSLTAMYKCNLTQEELDQEYIGLYTPGEMMNDPLYYGQISYNSSLSKLKLRPNVKLFLEEVKAATGKDIAEHVIRPSKVIPTNHVLVSYAPLLISILRLWRDLMKLNQWWMRTQVGKRLIVVLMQDLIEWIELIIFNVLVGFKCLSVKDLTSRWMWRGPEFEPMCVTDLGATARDHRGREDNRQRYKRGSRASGWWGGPRSR